MTPAAARGRRFRLLSSHGLVLQALTNHGIDLTYRELAGIVGMTERNVILVVRDLADAGLVKRDSGQGRIRHKRATVPKMMIVALRVIDNPWHGRRVDAQEGGAS